MNVVLNGCLTAVSECSTVESLLLEKELELDKVVVEYNLGILKSIDWSHTVLKENDKLEVLRFVGGG